MFRKIRIVSLVSFFLMVLVILSACADAGPEPGFDVTGLWREQGGSSTIEFSEDGGYDVNFSPSLSDGTKEIRGESYNRVDNSNITFTVIMGRASLEYIEVEASINSENVLKFKIDGNIYRFVKE